VCVCGVCAYELLHKCGGMVFADVCGDIQICNYVCQKDPVNVALFDEAKLYQGACKQRTDQFNTLTNVCGV